MRCETAKELFSDFLEGSIERPLALTVQQHLDECPVCNREYLEFRAIWRGLDALPEVEPPSSFRRQVMARVVRERAAAPRRVPIRAPNWGSIFSTRVPARAFAVAFVVLLMVAAAVQISQYPGAIQTGTPLPAIGRDFPRHSDALGRGDTGLELSVVASSIDGVGSYRILVQPKKSDVNDLRLYLLPEGQSRFNRSALEGYPKIDVPSSGLVLKSGPGTAYLEWYRGEERFTEVVFMPSELSREPQMVNFEATETTLYSALAEVSRVFGVVIVADADLGNEMIDAEIYGTADDALREIQADMEFVGSPMRFKKTQGVIYTVTSGE